MEKIPNLELFRFRNKLLKKDLAEYLGVSSAFVGQICRGVTPLPSDKLEALLHNDRGWDTEALLIKANIRPEEETTDDILRDIRDSLRDISKYLQGLQR